jgi:sugar phosphate isomerase/epimerase
MTLGSDMKVGLSTWSLLELDVVRSINQVGESGVRCIELWGEPPHASPGGTDVAAVKDALSRYDLEVSVHGPFHDLNLGCVYPSVLESISKTLREFTRFAEKVGATTVTFHPGHAFTEGLVDESIRGAVHVLKEVVKEAGGAVSVNIENEILNDSGFAFYLGSRNEWFDHILSKVPELGVTLDTGHSNVNGEDPVRFLKRYGRRVSHVHLNNNHGRSDEHNVLRDGTLDAQSFLKSAGETEGLCLNLELNPQKYSPKRVLSEAKSLL